MATVLPRGRRGSVDPRLGQRDQRGQRPRDQRATATTAGPGRGRAAPRARRRSRGRRARRPPGGSAPTGPRDLGLDVEPGLVEVAAVERRVDPGVVGVDVEVERQGERLGVAVAALLLLAAAGDERRGADDERGAATRVMPRAAGPRARPTRRCRRSISARPPNSTIASAERTTTAANTRAVCSCPWATRIRWPSPSSEPDHSPNTAPITATAAAILAPLNRYGSADGTSTRRRVWPGWRRACASSVAAPGPPSAGRRAC